MPDSRPQAGIGGTIPPHVTHPPVGVGSEGQPLKVTVAVVVAGGASVVDVEIVDGGTNTTVGKASAPSAATGNATTVDVAIPEVKLWSPESRALYVAVVTLRTGGDVASTRFGVRTIGRDGHKFMLNGLRLFLNGFGDDAIYPLTVSPPRDKVRAIFIYFLLGGGGGGDFCCSELVPARMLAPMASLYLERTRLDIRDC